MAAILQLISAQQIESVTLSDKRRVYNTLTQQQELLLREESQSILQQAKHCSPSIIGLEDSSSFISENTAGISLAFNFDAFVLASKIY
ncbi:hypothetical protein F5B22DRAFT_651372 [Xylaria bambusicola]|uniref:uncharacterized protein n=1 Tax=Xylaria bambusicola TaxID=326684 RepID=UPI0020082752|nr:uncharacterized protein F5B22DRAFT_651372 [Xylaria bambusicola]KAI0505826.1 hypothetical protein F5B22DRAFT_651372 [Xylaria bambusicola]